MGCMGRDGYGVCGLGLTGAPVAWSMGGTCGFFVGLMGLGGSEGGICAVESLHRAWVWGRLLKFMVGSNAASFVCIGIS